MIPTAENQTREIFSTTYIFKSWKFLARLVRQNLDYAKN